MSPLTKRGGAAPSRNQCGTVGQCFGTRNNSSAMEALSPISAVVLQLPPSPSCSWPVGLLPQWDRSNPPPGPPPSEPLPQGGWVGYKTRARWGRLTHSQDPFDLATVTCNKVVEDLLFSKAEKRSNHTVDLLSGSPTEH